MAVVASWTARSQSLRATATLALVHRCVGQFRIDGEQPLQHHSSAIELTGIHERFAAMRIGSRRLWIENQGLREIGHSFVVLFLFFKCQPTGRVGGRAVVVEFVGDHVAIGDRFRKFALAEISAGTNRLDKRPNRVSQRAAPYNLRWLYRIVPFRHMRQPARRMLRSALCRDRAASLQSAMTLS